MKNIVRLVATFVSILLTAATPAVAERDLETGVFLSRDPAGFVDGPNLYSYVRQNPWSKFDPEGLSEFALGYDPAILTPKEREVISGENKKQVVVGSVAVVAVGATVVAPQAYAYVLVNPGSAYAVTEAVTTAGEIATGYDGPPIIPGPGDILRAEVQAAKQATQAIEKTAVKTAEQATKAVEKSIQSTAKGTVYEVGLAKDLRKNPVPGTQVNHVPGSAPSSTLVGGHNPANKFGNEPAMRLPISEHEAVSAAQNALGAQASARDLLAKEAQILRNKTNAPNSAVQDAIKLSKETHPWDYRKTTGGN